MASTATVVEWRAIKENPWQYQPSNPGWAENEMTPRLFQMNTEDMSQLHQQIVTVETNYKGA